MITSDQIEDIFAEYYRARLVGDISFFRRRGFEGFLGDRNNSRDFLEYLLFKFASGADENYRKKLLDTWESAREFSQDFDARMGIVAIGFRD